MISNLIVLKIMRCDEMSHFPVTLDPGRCLLRQRRSVVSLLLTMGCLDVLPYRNIKLRISNQISYHSLLNTLYFAENCLRNGQ